MKTNCPKCNVSLQIDDTQYRSQGYIDYVCPVCNHNFRIMLHTEAAQQPSPTQSVQARPVQARPIQAQPVKNTNTPSSNAEIIHDDSEHKSPWLWIIPCIILLICAAVGGWFYYDKVYLPEKIDREAPRFYTIATSTNIRSSKTAGGDFNKIGSVPFGSELITYTHDTDWSEVKDANGNKGYISSNYIVEKSDFYRLNSIFGDAPSREIIATVKCRLALLSYFKEHNFIGKISTSDLANITPQVSPDSNNQWQVFCRAKGVKPNSVYFARVTNLYSKFTDFAVIITNIVSKEKRMLLFSFDDNENPSLVYEEETSGDYIESIECYDGNNYVANYYYVN